MKCLGFPCAAGAVGLILPAMTGFKPKLMPFAAFGLKLIMIFAAVFHIVRGEYNFVPINLVLGGSPRSSRMDRWPVLQHSPELT